MDRILTTEEVAEFLRFSPAYIRTLVAKGDLPAFRPAGSDQYRFVESQILGVLKERAIADQQMILFQRSQPTTDILPTRSRGRPRKTILN